MEKKKLSGAENRKRKQEEQKKIQKLPKIFNYFSNKEAEGKYLNFFVLYDS